MARAYRHWTPDEDARVVAEYAEACRLGRRRELAESMDRTVPSLSNRAQMLGLGDYSRDKDWRAQYKWDRETARAWLRLFIKEARRGGTVQMLCRKHGLNSDKVGRAISAHFPLRWMAVVEKTCEKNRWYAVGKGLERDVVNDLKKLGFRARRSYRSLGIDVEAVKLRDGIGYLVACRRGGYIAPEEWNDLVDQAERDGYTPLIAARALAYRYWLVTGRKSGRSGRANAQPWIPVQLTPAGLVPVLEVAGV